MGRQNGNVASRPYVSRVMKKRGEDSELWLQKQLFVSLLLTR